MHLLGASVRGAYATRRPAAEIITTLGTEDLTQVIVTSRGADSYLT